MYVQKNFPPSGFENLQQLDQTTQHFHMPSQIEIAQQQHLGQDMSTGLVTFNTMEEHQPIQEHFVTEEKEEQEIIPVKTGGQTLYIRVNKKDPTKPQSEDQNQQQQDFPPQAFIQPMQEFIQPQQFVPQPQFMPVSHYDVSNNNMEATQQQQLQQPLPPPAHHHHPQPIQPPPQHQQQQAVPVGTMMFPSNLLSPPMASVMSPHQQQQPVSAMVYHQQPLPRTPHISSTQTPQMQQRQLPPGMQQHSTGTIFQNQPPPQHTTENPNVQRVRNPLPITEPPPPQHTTGNPNVQRVRNLLPITQHSPPQQPVENPKMERVRNPIPITQPPASVSHQQKKNIFQAHSKSVSSSPPLNATNGISLQNIHAQQQKQVSSSTNPTTPHCQQQTSSMNDSLVYSTLPTQKQLPHPSQMLFQDLPANMAAHTQQFPSRHHQQQKQNFQQTTNNIKKTPATTPVRAANLQPENVQISSTPQHHRNHQSPSRKEQPNFSKSPSRPRSSQVQRVNTNMQVSNHNSFDSQSRPQSRVSSSNEGSSHTTGTIQCLPLPITSCTGGGVNRVGQNERAYSVDPDDFSDMPFRTIQRNLLSHDKKSSLSTEDSYYSGSDESTHHPDVYRFCHDDLHDMLRDKNLEIKTNRELDTIVAAIIHPYPDQPRTKLEKLRLIRHNSHKLLEKERFQRTFQHYRTFNESHYTNLYRLYSNENLNIRGMLKHFHTKANMGSPLAQWLCGIFFLVNEKQICHVIRRLWTNKLPIPGLDRTFFEIIQEAIMDDQLYLLDVIIPLIKFINNQLLRAPQISLPLIQPNSSYVKAFRGSKLNLNQLRQIETGKVYKTAMYLSTCKTMKEARKWVGPNNIYVVFHMPTNCKYIGTLLGQNDEHVIIPPYTSVRVKKIRNMEKHFLLIVQLFDNADLPEHQTTILL